MENSEKSKKGFFSKFKEKHPKTAKAVVITGKVVAVAMVAVATATIAFVALNDPAPGKNSIRAHFRKDGIPKIGYGSPQRANAQALKDALLHKTIMHPYKCPVCDNYHVGHKH